MSDNLYPDVNDDDTADANDMQYHRKTSAALQLRALRREGHRGVREAIAAAANLMRAANDPWREVFAKWLTIAESQAAQTIERAREGTTNSVWLVDVGDDLRRVAVTWPAARGSWSYYPPPPDVHPDDIGVVAYFHRLVGVRTHCRIEIARAEDVGSRFESPQVLFLAPAAAVLPRALAARFAEPCPVCDWPSFDEARRLEAEALRAEEEYESLACDLAFAAELRSGSIPFRQRPKARRWHWNPLCESYPLRSEDVAAETRKMPDDRLLCRTCLTKRPSGYKRGDDLVFLLQERLEKRQEELREIVDEQYRRARRVRRIAESMNDESPILTITQRKADTNEMAERADWEKQKEESYGEEE